MPITMTREIPSKVLAKATETNDQAVAVVTAGTNQSRIYVTGIDAFYDDPDITGSLELKQGSTVVWGAQMHGQVNINFLSPLVFDPETSVSVELQAGGSDVVGVVNIRGYISY